MASTSLARLTCLCGAMREPGTLLRSDRLPIHIQMCHCNPCRLTTGATGVSFPPLRSAPSPATLRNLVAYRSSDILTRYFCAQCGCHVFLHIHAEGDQGWRCLGGVIEQDDSPGNDGHSQLTNNDTKQGKGDSHVAWPADVVIISNHDYIADTLDGGIVPMLRQLGGRDVPLWSEEPDAKTPTQTGDMTVADLSSMLPQTANRLSDLDSEPGVETDQYLTAKCHCGGVHLLVARANYPLDLQARYVPSDRSKFLTYPCTCRSCRLSAGVSLFSFTSVPPTNIFNGAMAKPELEKAHDRDLNSSLPAAPIAFGPAAQLPNANPGQTLQHYWSSKEVCRSFCGRCGASVFYWNALRQDEIDVASGILRADEGTMARTWLEWDWGRCSFPEECTDQLVRKAWYDYRE